MKDKQVAGGDGGMFNKPSPRRRCPSSLHGRQRQLRQSV